LLLALKMPEQDREYSNFTRCAFPIAGGDAAGVKNKPEFQMLETERFVSALPSNPTARIRSSPSIRSNIMRAAIAASSRVCSRNTSRPRFTTCGRAEEDGRSRRGGAGAQRIRLDAAKLFARAQDRT